jgi:hypothetical protein
VAEPDATAVTSPLVLTVAIALLLVDQLTVLLVALVGATVAVSWVVPPTVKDAVVAFKVTPVTGTVDDVDKVTLSKTEVFNNVLSCEHTSIPTYTAVFNVMVTEFADVHVTPSVER